MPYDYIRKTYGVNARAGQRITMDGQPGIIVATDLDPMYLKVRFDGSLTVSNVHPTWNVDYEPQLSFAHQPARLEAAHG